MGKKRFLTCFLVVLLIAILTVSLVACKEKSSQIDVNPQFPVASDGSAPSVGEYLLAMLKGMGYTGDYVSMNFDSKIKVNVNAGKFEDEEKTRPLPAKWEYRTFYLKGNFFNGQVGEKGEVELGIGLLNEANPDEDFEIFLKEGRFYMKVAGTSLYLEDIDFRWVIEQIKKLESLDNVVQKILAAIPNLGISGTVDELIGIVAMLIFEVDEKYTTYNKDTKTGHIALKFVPDQLIDTIKTAIGGTSIDGVLAGVGIGLKGPDGTPISIDEFLAGLAFPNIDVIVEADVVKGKVNMEDIDGQGMKGLKLKVKDYQTEYFYMDTTSGFTPNKIDIIPENIDTYVPFGLLKLQFNTEIAVKGDGIDVGKLINLFAGSGFMPEKSLLLSAELDLTIKLDVDIRLKEEKGAYNEETDTYEMDDKSLLLLEVYSKRMGGDTPILGIYLKDKKVYVNLDNVLKMAGGNIDIAPGNIVISNVPISNMLTRLLKYGTDTVAGLIDDFFGKKDAPKAASTFANIGDNGFDYDRLSDVVLTLGHDEEGTTYISKTVGTILDILRYTIGFEDYFTYDKKTGNINIKVNKQFIDKLVNQFNINIEGFDIGSIGDFGEINLGIDVNDNGLKDVYLDLNLGEEPNNLKVRVEMNNFHYGFGHRDALLAQIDKATAGKKYASNVKDLIFDALHDLDLEFGLELSFGKGTYSTSNLFGNDLTDKLPKVDIVVDDDFVMQLKLQIQVQMNDVLKYKKDGITVETDADGNPVYETIISRAKITITNVVSNPIFPQDNMVITLYYIDDRYDPNGDLWGVEPAQYKYNATRDTVEKSHGTLFADLSQLNMMKIEIPSFAMDIDLTEQIYSLIGGLNLDFALPDITFPWETTPDENVEGEESASLSIGAGMFASNKPVISEKEDSIFYALYDTENAEKIDTILKINLTSAMINKVLELANLNFDFELPEKIDVELNVDYIQGISMNIGTYDGDKAINLNLSVLKFITGRPYPDLGIDMTGLDIESYGGVYIKGLDDILGGIIHRALDDVDIKFNASLHLDAGTYHTNNILGINTGLPDIPIESKDGFDFAFEISIQLQSAMVDKVDIKGVPELDADGNPIQEQIISRAMITIQNLKKNPITPNGNGVIRIMYFDDRYEGNENLGLKPYKYDENTKTVVKSHGTLLLNLSTFNILKFQLPDVALDIDLTEMINNIIGNMSLSDLSFNVDNNDNNSSVAKLFSLINDGTTDGNTEGSEGSDTNEPVSFVEIKITTELINQILKMIPNVNLGFTLPDLDGGIKVDANEGITLDVNTADADKNISLHLGMNWLRLGREVKDSDFVLPMNNEHEDGTKYFDITKFGNPAELNMDTLLPTIVYRALDDADIQFNLKFDIAAGKYDVSKILSMFGLEMPAINIEVSQQFVLDLTLRIQIRWNQFELNNEKLDEYGITRAQITLVNNTSNIFFPTTGPVLNAYYFDERGPRNSSLNIFHKGENGKKTYGGLYIDLSGFNFAKVTLPSLALDIDLTELIKNLVNNLDFGGGTEEAQALIAEEMGSMFASDMNVGVVADGTDTDETGNYLRVAITIELIKNLLKQIGGNINIDELPPLLDSVNGDLTISEIQGIKLKIGLKDDAKELNLNLGINHIKLGLEDTPINFPDGFDSAKYGFKALDVNDKEFMKSMLFRALDDTYVEMNLKLNVPAGKYNVASILELAGIKTDEVLVTFTKPCVLDLTLKINMQFETVNAVNEIGNPTGEMETILARANISIVNNGDEVLCFKSGTIMSIYYFDDRFDDNKELLSEYRYHYENGEVTKSHGTIFAEFPGLKIANITVPPLTVDLDVNSLLEQIAIGINFNSSIGTKVLNNNNSGVSLVADTEGEENSETDNYIKIVIVTKVVEELLKALNVDLGTFKLPEFEVGLLADQNKGISITIELNDNYQGNKTITGSLALPNLNIGHDDASKKVDMSNFHIDKYKTPLKNIIKDLVQYGQISAKVNLSANESQINIRRLLNNILSASGMSIALPINVDLNDFANELILDIKWTIDYENPKNSEFLIKLTCDQVVAMAIYVMDGNVYVDLSGLGLPKFALVESSIVNKLIGLIEGAFDGILEGIMGAGNSTYNLQAMAAKANNETIEQMNDRIFAESREGEENGIMDYVQLLIAGLGIEDGKITADITVEMVRELLKKLSINIAEDIEIHAVLDIFNGEIKVNARFDEIYLGAELKVVNIGKKFTIDDMPKYNDLRDFPELNFANANIFVNNLFDNLDPGLWIDLVSKNAAITDDNFLYTKITMEKVGPDGKSLPETTGGWANAGSILLTLRRYDGKYGNASGAPVLYIIVDVNSGRIVIRATTNLLPKIAGLVNADTMVNIPINLDIKGTLINLLGPIITEVNKTDAAPVGIQDALNDFEIGGLLREINIKLYGVRNIKINVKLDHDVINEFIPKLINGLNGERLDLFGNGGFIVSGMNYDNVHPTNLIEQFWNLIITPIVDEAVKNEGLGFLSGIVQGEINAENVKGRITDLLRRLLPMPEFTELNANVYIVNGKLDNIDLIGYGGEDPTDPARHRLELRIFNDMSAQVFYGTMDSLDLNNTEFQAPYIYYEVATDREEDFKDMFTQTAYRPLENKMYYEATLNSSKGFLVTHMNVNWYVTSFQAPNGELQTFDIPKLFSKSDMSAFQDGSGNYVAGTYKTYVEAIGGPAGCQRIVTVVIADNKTFIMDENTKVQDITIRPGRSIENVKAITLVNGDKTLRLDRGFELVGANHDELTETTKNATVKITIIGETATTDKDITIHYMDRELYLPGVTEENGEIVDPAPYRINIHDYKSFYNGIYKRSEYQVKTSDGRLIYQKAKISIKEGEQALFNENGSIANTNLWASATGFTTWLKIELEEVSTKQPILYKKVIVEPRQIAFVRFDSKDRIVMNRIQTSDDLPQKVRVYFETGVENNYIEGVYDVDFTSWDVHNVNWGVSGNYENVSFKFVSDYDGGESIENVNKYSKTVVFINNAVIKYAKVGADNGRIDCDISYEDFADKKFEGFKIRLVTSDNKVAHYKSQLTYWTENMIDSEITDAEGNTTTIKVKEYVTVDNYKIIDRGITTGNAAGNARVTVRLYNWTLDSEDRLVMDESKYIEVYMYFNVAPPIALMGV